MPVVNWTRAAMVCLAGGVSCCAASAATLYSTVNPGTTDINTLAASGLQGTSWIGAFDDSGFSDTGPKGAPSHGVFFTPAIGANLAEAQVPLNIGATMGELRMELYEVPGITATTSSFTLLDTATASGLTGGKQWVIFDFSAGGTSLLDTAKSYLLFLTVTHTGPNRYATQQHYWLGTSNTTSGTLFRDYDYYALGSTVPVQDLRAPSLVNSRFHPGLYLSDVSSTAVVPTPAAAAGGLVLLSGLAMKRRRA